MAKPAGHDINRLADVAPELESILTQGSEVALLHLESEIQRKTVWVVMRDGVRLATDIYLPPAVPAPALAMRTPYGRNAFSEGFVKLARQGYVVVLQDCRGTGDSEPANWDMFVYEREDSIDFVEWAVHQQWFDGFLGSMGGSYNASTQWAMAMHPRMSAIGPEVGGLCVRMPSVRYYMFVNAFSRTVGKGSENQASSYIDMERSMLDETLGGGYFNQPLHSAFSEALRFRHSELDAMDREMAKSWLWNEYCSSPPAARADLMKTALEAQRIDYEEIWAFRFLFDHREIPGWVVLPSESDRQLAQSIRAPAFMISGWYDWGLSDTLATWEILTRDASEPVTSRSCLLISPNAHNCPGYHEDKEAHPNLAENYRRGILDLRLRWYSAIRDETAGSWPRVIYYLMGANDWRTAAAWPPAEARNHVLYLAENGQLVPYPPDLRIGFDRYTYDPNSPTPTIGGSIVSYVFTPGSVDVSEVQRRPDLVTYTTEILDRDLDVVGPVRLILFVSSDATDTDFSARLTDVFPDGRAIQLQSGILRTRYRNVCAPPELLEPGRVYRIEVDMWATANRFRAGHRLRIDVSSADFPRFDRNSNRGDEIGPAKSAHQTIYRDRDHPSHLIVSLINS